METGKVLIDTSILIEYFRKKRKETTIFVELSQKHTIAISVITEFEWLVGFKEKNTEFCKNLLERLDILPFDSTCAARACGIYTNLKSRNQLVEIPDIFIAATALVYGMPLATCNKNHFKRIAGIELL